MTFNRVCQVGFALLSILFAILIATEPFLFWFLWHTTLEPVLNPYDYASSPGGLPYFISFVLVWIITWTLCSYCANISNSFSKVADELDKVKARNCPLCEKK